MYYPINFSASSVDKRIESYSTEYASVNFSKPSEKMIESFTDTINLPDVSDVNISEFFKISQITNNIYLSGVMVAQDINKIKEYNISCIVNCTKTIPNYFDNISYLRVPVDDTNNQNIEQYFDETYNFIENCIKDNKNVLVHCHAGISRSSTILIAYFMRKNNWDLQKALDFLRSKRSIVNPNSDFIKALNK